MVLNKKQQKQLEDAKQKAKSATKQLNRIRKDYKKLQFDFEDADALNELKDNQIANAKYKIDRFDDKFREVSQDYTRRIILQYLVLTALYLGTVIYLKYSQNQ